MSRRLVDLEAFVHSGTCEGEPSAFGKPWESTADPGMLCATDKVWIVWVRAVCAERLPAERLQVAPCDDGAMWDRAPRPVSWIRARTMPRVSAKGLPDSLVTPIGGVNRYRLEQMEARLPGLVFGLGPEPVTVQANDRAMAAATVFLFEGGRGLLAPMAATGGAAWVSEYRAMHAAAIEGRKH